MREKETEVLGRGRRGEEKSRDRHTHSQRRKERGGEERLRKTMREGDIQ